MKYRINGTGNIVAERDIYSLGGFIPKGGVGGKIASEEQLSQDGDCWLAAGDISGRPDIVIKDNAYVGTFTPGDGSVHTDGVTEFSGNTIVPGPIIVRNLIGDPVSDFYAKDSFIGVSMDVLCGPDTTTKAFPFVQGKLDQKKPAGTPTGNMVVADANACFSKAVLRPGKDTWVYVPTGKTARLLWAYYGTENTTIYSGEFETLREGLHKVSHHTYGVCFVTFYSSTAMTPTDLLATGAKILGHISGSLLMDLRPESVSGKYVIDNSSFIMNTDNFGLATTQVRFLAGGLYNTTMYTKTDRPDYKPYGTFRNVERLEYTKYLGDSHRTAATRDTYISAYDCPLLRVDGTTYNDALAAEGNLTLRRCVVPNASFAHDVVNGNTYEDIDFSYANEFIRNVVAGRNLYSSHREGLYACESNGELLGLISYPGNMDDTARLYQAEDYMPLGGDIIEQGSYGAGGVGSHYEASKSGNPTRIRTGKPLATFGLVFPSLPAGYSVRTLYYLDEDFVIRSAATDPTEIVTTYPYVVMLFRKDDDSAINVTDFIALNRTLRIIDHTKVPEITGSAYVGAGCTVRGDVQLHGDPYVNRVLDVNMWEKGSLSIPDNGWEASKNPPGGPTDVDRRRLKNVIQVEPGARIMCNSGYWVSCYFYDSAGNYLSSSGWGQMANTVPANAAFAGMILKKGAAHTDSLYIEDSDIPLANVKYLRAFKKRRYITNELDRTIPEDMLLSVDYWEQGYVDRVVGPTYEALKSVSVNYIRLRLPVNAGMGVTATQAAGYGRIAISLDSLTKCVSTDAAIKDGTPLCGAVIRKDPTSPITLAEVPSSRFKIEFTPSPRIVAPYGRSTLLISGPKIRMYGNAVLSRNLNQRGEIVLQDDAVMGYDFNSGECLCSNGHSDTIIKLP